jgi:hypothetical protein
MDDASLVVIKDVMKKMEYVIRVMSVVLRIEHKNR